MIKYSLLIIMLLPLLGSLLGYYIGIYSELNRNRINIGVTALNLIIVSMLFPYISHGHITLFVPNIMGIGLSLKLDMFRYVFLWLTAMVWFLTTLYTTQYLLKYTKRNRYYAFFMLTYASTVGIFISDNLLNLFTFFEIMSLASYALVIHDEDQYSHEAGISYIAMALAGGLVLLTGLILLFEYTGTLLISDFTNGIEDIGNIRYLIATLIIIGFGVKASMFPLHTWLPKAYAAAPTPATAVLSGVLVKTGIFGVMITVLNLMHGDLYISMAIIVIGCINIIHGGVLAVMQRNIKRILAYSSMSQVGYILLGIGLVGMNGEEGGLALIGALYHIFNHALFKVLLFMGVGIIYMVIHELSINKIQGFGKYKNTLKFVFLIGCLATMGMPGTNGFISKTLIHEAIIEAGHMHYRLFFDVVEMFFIIGASLTVAYLMKIFVAVFVEGSVDYQGQFRNSLRKRALFPMTLLGIGILLIGLMPNFIFKILEDVPLSYGLAAVHSPDFFTIDTIISFVNPLIMGVFIYLFYVRGVLRKKEYGIVTYFNPSLKWMDLERDVYRPVTNFIFIFSSTILKYADRGVIHIFIWIKERLFEFFHIQIEYQSFDLSLKASEFGENTQHNIENQSKKVKKNVDGVIGKGARVFNQLKINTQVKSRNVKEIYSGIGNYLNSLVYTVMTFIFVLVLILVFMKFG